MLLCENSCFEKSIIPITVIKQGGHSENVLGFYFVLADDSFLAKGPEKVLDLSKKI